MRSCGRIFITSSDDLFVCWIVMLFSLAPPTPQPLDVAGTWELDIRIQVNSCVRRSLTYPRDFSGPFSNQKVAYMSLLESSKPLYCVLKLPIVPRSCSAQDLLHSGIKFFCPILRMPVFPHRNHI